MQIEAIAALRTQLAAIGRVESRTAPCLPFGLPALDGCLPAGGLALGAMHEVSAAGPAVEHAVAPALFAAGVLARRPGPVLWVLAAPDLYPPALARAGLHPARVVFVHTRDGTLRATEEALRHPGLAGVVCEHAGALGLTASRRLQLAAEGSGALGLLLRRSRRHDDPALLAPSAAATRWRITALPSPPPLPHAPDVPGLGPALWRLELLRCRGGAPTNLTVEAPDAQGRLAVPAHLAHRPLAPARPRRVAGAGAAGHARA